jgi:2,5-diamino-6-(ribosylamino)-4(3H)-pyrimidinone 5'-phosphate reductase
LAITASRAFQPGKVTVNFAVSVDGRITTRTREHVALGSENDRRLMDELRVHADGIIIGAGTVRHDGRPMILRYEDLHKRRIAKRLPINPVNVVLTHTLDLSPSSRFFDNQDVRRIVFTTSRAPKARVRQFSHVAEVVVLPGADIDPKRVMSELRKRDIKRVLLEGGGEVHFSFAQAGLVGDLFVTVTPRLIGGKDAPSLLDGDGFLWKDHIALKLVSSRRVGEEIFLHYRVAAARPRPARTARARQP